MNNKIFIIRTKVWTKARRGFTLIEVILYTTLVAIIATAATTLFLSYLDVQTKNRVLEEVAANSRVAITRITQAIQSANDVNLGSSIFGTNPGKLVLTMEDAVIDPTEFDVSAGALRIKEGSGSPQVLTGSLVNVSNLIFTNLTVTGKIKDIQVNLTVTHLNPQNDPRYDATLAVQTAASLRKE